MSYIYVPYIINNVSTIMVDGNTSNKLNMKVLKSRYTKTTVNSDYFLPINDIKIGDFVKLKNHKNYHLNNYKNHAFIVVYNTYVVKNRPYKLLNLTLKEQTGYNYCIYVYSHEIEEDKKTERIYKLKSILNGKTNFQKQRKSEISNRKQRVLALSFSCD